MEFTKLVSSIELPCCGTAVGVLQLQAADIRGTRINWSSYFQSQMISADEYQFIMKYDYAKNAEERSSVIKDNPQNAVRVFVHVLNKIAKEEIMQYLLTLVDDMLQEDKQRVEHFHDYFNKIKDSIMDNFFCYLRQENKFIVYQASRIMSKLACWSSSYIGQSDIQFFFQWILCQLQIEDSDYMDTVVRNLQMILRRRQYRLVFVECGGIESIVEIITGKLNTQIQYQLIFCLWCLSFDADLVLQMIKTPSLITIVSDIIRNTEREKVIRISLAYFRSLIEKLDSPRKVREVALVMVHCKILKKLELLQQKDYSHDPELTEDLAFVMETLHRNVQYVSSLEEYTIELKSGRLEWSPVHKSETFWRENADKFIDKNYELLKMLVRILETNKDHLTLQVSIHDIGEFARNYPRGKQIVEKLGAKRMVMELLYDNDPGVKYHALVALHKIMVHNWAYLGKKLQSQIEQRQGPSLL